MFLKLTPKTFNKFHVSKNFHCIDFAFKNPLFYQCLGSGDYYSIVPKSSFLGSGIKRPTDSTTSITCGQTDTTSEQAKYYEWTDEYYE